MGGIGAPKPLEYPIKTLGRLKYTLWERSIENKTQMSHFAAVFPAYFSRFKFAACSSKTV